ncbi:hypothetical protein QQP08_014421 [Theobroma cacao]|nr:hypothetical protein QQP08_014421 [Theobroma cacao]
MSPVFGIIGKTTFPGKGATCRRGALYINPFFLRTIYAALLNSSARIGYVTSMKHFSLPAFKPLSTFALFLKMGERKFVKIAQVMMMLVLIILSAILAPTTARPLNIGQAVVGGVALHQASVPPIGPSGCTHLPISKGICPPLTPVHG